MDRSLLRTLIRHVLRGFAPGSQKPKRAHRAALLGSAESLECRELLAMVGVDVINFAFAPNPVTIHQGDTVHWVWDMNNLSTTSVAGSAETWDSGVHDAEFTFDHTFTHVGTFTYYSTTQGHDQGNGTATGMTGTIIVLPPATLMMIMVMPSNFSISAGTTQQFMAMGMYSDNVMTDVTDDVTWSSTSTSVATVSSAPGSRALVAGVAPGVSQISVSLGGVMGSTELTVAQAPLVTLMDEKLVFNKKHLVTGIILGFTGALDVTDADNVANYSLAPLDTKGSGSAKIAKTARLRSAVYSPASNTVVLTPRSPFSVAKPLELGVSAELPMGLHDSAGRLIDGNHDGQTGGNALIVLRRNGASLS
jgi:plastocyanin